MLRILMAGVALCLCSAGPSVAHAQPPASPADANSPLETIIVIGTPRDTRGDVGELVFEPALEGRLSTLDDLFRGTPGVVLEPVFGGIDHPRFSIRGSGLQRGTQPAGRGIELRLDGVPMTYADTSFDFVEWIDPLFFDTVTVLRGGRGVLDAATALGGIVNFSARHDAAPRAAWPAPRRAASGICAVSSPPAAASERAASPPSPGSARTAFASTTNSGQAARSPGWRRT